MRTLARSPAAVNGDLPALKPDAIVAVRGRFLEGCRYVAPLEPSSLERLYREIDAQKSKVWSADFDRLICPWWPVCDPVVGGRVVKVDSNHLTAAYATAIAADVAEYLKANGLIPAVPASPPHGQSDVAAALAATRRRASVARLGAVRPVQVPHRPLRAALRAPVRPQGPRLHRLHWRVSRSPWPNRTVSGAVVLRRLREHSAESREPECREVDVRRNREQGPHRPPSPGRDAAGSLARLACHPDAPAVQLDQAPASRDAG